MRRICSHGKLKLFLTSAVNMHIKMRVNGFTCLFVLSAAFSDPPFDSRVLTETHALNLFSLPSQEHFSL